jgi:hypothetical protein
VIGSKEEPYFCNREEEERRKSRGDYSFMRSDNPTGTIDGKSLKTDKRNIRASAFPMDFTEIKEEIFSFDNLTLERMKRYIHYRSIRNLVWHFDDIKSEMARKRVASKIHPI